MNNPYIVGGYLLTGAFILFFALPLFLEKSGLKKEENDSFLESTLAYMFGPLIFLALLIWPILVPLSIWFYSSSIKAEKEYQKTREEEKKKRENDKFYDLSMNEKIELLRQHHKNLKNGSNQSK